jgi:SAM-dependent methyltransferase
LPPTGGREDTAGVSREEYLLGGRPSELERLQLQSRVWEPSGRQLLSKIGDGSGGRALDVGCGALGWLRILVAWVGASGEVVGTDIDESLLDAARSFLAAEGISNVELVVDDLFSSKLEPRSFDLVHARYVIAPLGRGPKQVASQRRLLRPGGTLVLEEWDLGSWHFNPPAPAAERLIRLLSEIFAALGGEAGRGLPELLREIGIEEAEIDAHVIALKPGHPYLRLPLQFSVALESRLLETLSADELASLRSEAESELAAPGRWGTTFTLIQSWGTVEA